MTPGTKVQPADDVSHLAWNKQGLLYESLIVDGHAEIYISFEIISQH